MRISALCNHLRHPITYTDGKGKTQQLSSKEISQVALFVVSSLAVATFEAITSNRSLKTSFVSIGTLTVAAFYLATAIMKMGSRGDGSSPGSNVRKGVQPVQGKNGQVSNIPKASTTELPGNSKWVYVDGKEEATRGREIDSTKASNPSEHHSVSSVNLIEVSGCMDKSGWVNIDNSSNSINYSEHHSVCPVNLIEVSGVMDKSEGADIDNPPNSSEGKERGVDLTVSVFGPGVNEWVSIADSPKSSGSERRAKEEKKETADLTASVFGPGVDEWTSIADSPSSLRSYQELTLTEDQIKVISNMFKIISDTFLPLLLLKKSELLDLGQQIENVHPLKFLQAILTQPEIKESMLDIKGSGLKWNGFLNGDKDSSGFIAKCKKADDLGTFAPYITDFCQAVNVDSQKFLSYYKAKKWGDLISFLIQ